VYTLRQLLYPNYAVIPVGEQVILKEPWTATCALLVVPGGADLGYLKAFEGLGIRRITQYVQSGGQYLGFCAGGYFGSARCEFEMGDKNLEVIGDRPLKFFPGTCLGAVFKGFQYGSELGARAARIALHRNAFPATENLPTSLRCYFNGGGVFVGAEKMMSEGVETLASYEDELDVDGQGGKAAIVYRKVGDGAAMLTGIHPE